MRIEGEGNVHSIISRLQDKHGACKGDFDLAVLEEEPLTFADGSMLYISEAYFDDGSREGEIIPETYDLDFRAPTPTKIH